MSGYLTTNENGEFTGTITGLTAGQKIISATFEGDDEYNRSNINKHITILDPTIELSLTSPTEIIEMGNTTTITATLTKNGLPFVNQEISYEIKHGSTVIDADSDFTNNSGQITISYTGTGIGDIEVVAIYNSLEETFTIEDCIIYDPLTSNSGKWTIPSDVSSTYSSNGWNVSATSYSQVKLTDKITSDCSVELTLVDYNIVSIGGSCLVYAYTNGETKPNQVILDSRNTANSASAVFGRLLDHRFANGTKFRIDYTSDTLKVYENDVLIGTDSNSVGLPTRFEFHIGAGGRTVTYKDLKVKPLESLSLTGTSIIESGDTDTITATLLCGSTPVSGETLSYQIKHGSTVLDSGTGTTNANGEIEIIYTGTGVGDIDVIVSYGSDIQETFVVEDCILYRETLSTNITDLTLPPEYKLEFDIPSTSNSTYAIIGTDTTHRIHMGQMSNQDPSLNGVWIYNGSSTAIQNNCHTLPTQNAHYTFTYENNSYTMSNGESNITGTVPGGINMNNLLSTTYTPSAVRNYKIKAL